MPLSPHHMQPPQLRHPWRKLNVRSSPRHVRRNHHCPTLSRPRHNLRLQLMLLRIQYAVRNILPPEHSTNNFRGLHRSRSYQHWLTRCISLFDLLNQRIQLFPPSFKDQIIRILSHAIPIRRYHHHTQPINVLKLIRLRLRRSRHSCQLLIQTEIVLNRDRR